MLQFCCNTLSTLGLTAARRDMSLEFWLPPNAENFTSLNYLLLSGGGSRWPATRFLNNISCFPALNRLELLEYDSSLSTEAQCIEIGRSLVKLVFLDLSRNQLHTLPTAHWQALGRGFTRGAHRPQRWSLENPFLTPHAEVEASPGNQLSVLSLNGNHLGNISADMWGEVGNALAQLPNLKILIMKNNQLNSMNERQWQAFCQMIEQCQSLVEFDENELSFQRRAAVDRLLAAHRINLSTETVMLGLQADNVEVFTDVPLYEPAPPQETGKRQVQKEGVTGSVIVQSRSKCFTLTRDAHGRVRDMTPNTGPLALREDDIRDLAVLQWATFTQAEMFLENYLT